jgi:hypothetical protein
MLKIIENIEKTVESLSNFKVFQWLSRFGIN